MVTTRHSPAGSHRRTDPVDQLGDTSRSAGVARSRGSTCRDAGHVASPHRETSVQAGARVKRLLLCISTMDRRFHPPTSITQFRHRRRPATSFPPPQPRSSTSLHTSRMAPIREARRGNIRTESPGSTVRAAYRRSLSTRPGNSTTSSCRPSGRDRVEPEYRPSGGTSDGLFLSTLSPCGFWPAQCNMPGPNMRLSKTFARSVESTAAFSKKCSLRRRCASRGRRFASRPDILPRTSDGRRRSPGPSRNPWRGGCRPGPRSRPPRRRSRRRRP